MAKSRKSDLTAFAEGTGFLVRRPFAVLGLAALGMALGCLPPFLQIRAGLPDEDLVRLALGFAGTFPLEMYFIPRFLAEADANGKLGPHPRNPSGEWARHFDARWVKAFASRLLLYAGILLGLACLVLPGLLVLFAFCWVPLRVLLRGESFLDAARGSLRMMVRGWRRALGVALGILLVNLGYLLILNYALAYLGQEPTPWQRLSQPGVWIGNFLGTLLNLWSSACLVALFRRLEGLAEEAPDASSSGN